MKQAPAEKPMFAETVGDLVRQVTAITVGSNSKHWYRGQEDSSWHLLPSAFREGGTAKDMKARERNLLHTFRSRAGIRYERKPGFEDIAGWISLMQHYGLPTRLLDWSRSPLVAAYFAVERHLYDRSGQPTDACVWVLQPHSLNAKQGLGDVTVTIDSGMCRVDIEPAFYHTSKERKRVHAVMASETDLRMFVQQGAFTIHSTITPLDMLQFPINVLNKIVIPAQACESFALELSVAGFRKGDVFPDLQNLASDLANYSPRMRLLARDDA